MENWRSACPLPTDRTETYVVQLLPSSFTLIPPPARNDKRVREWLRPLPYPLVRCVKLDRERYGSGSPPFHVLKAGQQVQE